MAKVLFITENELKKSTAINDNVDSGELTSAIATAQDINLQESLGTELYDKLIDLVDAYVTSGTAIDPTYKTLLDDYIQPMIIHYAYYYAMDNFIMKFMNVGLVQGSSEQGTAIDIRLYQSLKSSAKSTAEFYDARLRAHLQKNTNLYPEFKYFTNDGSLGAKASNGYESSIVLPGKSDYFKYDPDCCKDRYKRLY